MRKNNNNNYLWCVGLWFMACRMSRQRSSFWWERDKKVVKCKFRGKVVLLKVHRNKNVINRTAHHKNVTKKVNWAGTIARKWEVCRIMHVTSNCYRYGTLLALLFLLKKGGEGIS